MINISLLRDKKAIFELGNELDRLTASIKNKKITALIECLLELEPHMSKIRRLKTFKLIFDVWGKSITGSLDDLSASDYYVLGRSFSILNPILDKKFYKRWFFNQENQYSVRDSQIILLALLYSGYSFILDEMIRILNIYCNKSTGLINFCICEMYIGMIYRVLNYYLTGEQTPNPYGRYFLTGYDSALRPYIEMNLAEIGTLQYYKVINSAKFCIEFNICSCQYE